MTILDALTAAALGFAITGLSLSVIAVRAASRDYYLLDVFSEEALRRVAVYAIRKTACVVMAQISAIAVIAFGWAMVHGWIGSDVALLARQSFVVVVTAALAGWALLDLRYRDRL